MEQDELYGKIYEVLTNQLFGVLATIENDTPHTAVVPFAVTNNLRTIIFLTKHHTDKFKNVTTDMPASFLVEHLTHSKRAHKGSFSVSAAGKAKLVNLEGATATKELFLFCHPSLAEYVDNKDYGLMSLYVHRYEVSDGISDIYHYKV